jgi:hypothetical protein
MHTHLAVAIDLTLFWKYKPNPAILPAAAEIQTVLETWPEDDALPALVKLFVWRMAGASNAID